MIPIVKYPRTAHITGSRLQPGDEDLQIVARDLLTEGEFVVEEKLDGANCGISFDTDGALILQSRGHALSGGPRERQFDLLKRWANHHMAALREILGSRYIMYGEWLYARHTIAYDQLPHYFLEFDILDREAAAFLGTPLRAALLAGGPIVSVPVLASGSMIDIEELVGLSRCASTQQMEGLYLKREEAGRVTDRYKYVQPDFLQAVDDSSAHWSERPIEPNQLRDGVDLFR